jgi:DNA modification methylase
LAQKALASHADEAFEVPLYNVWKQHARTAGSAHPGNSEIRWVDNLLYLYTQPFDVVVDPFAGGGSTLDICRRRLRRYWVSDRKPIPERANQIREHDVTTGLPPLPRWQDVRLVYLDPPYWAQAAGEYSNDPTDLANMPLDRFTETLAGLINNFGKKLSSGSVIALLMQPTQWRAPERAYTDHVIDIARLVKLPIDLRVSCPYESQQYNGTQVEWAKANRKVLVLSRELIVWRKNTT